IQTIPGKAERHRHARKYAQGELAEEKSFYFTGPAGKLHLRAQNLLTFVQIADGVDDETWLHHLRRHDYSDWMDRCIGDDELSSDVRAVEDNKKLSPGESRKLIDEAVRKRYTTG
ncbi:MAG: phosphoglycolate phosphatase, partial [Candidatus Eremiobacteraeota bacterium]|nr:phosphoglycolate phosphatase [Candidatus Eremiobacteraeota bacterium]